MAALPSIRFRRPAESKRLGEKRVQHELRARGIAALRARADSRAEEQLFAAAFFDKIYDPLNMVIPIVTAQRIPNEIAIA
jgi:hypothetical protein